MDQTDDPLALQRPRRGVALRSGCRADRRVGPDARRQVEPEGGGVDRDDAGRAEGGGDDDREQADRSGADDHDALAARVVLGGDEIHDAGVVFAQLRETFQVMLDPDGFAAFEAVLEIR